MKRPDPALATDLIDALIEWRIAYHDDDRAGLKAAQRRTLAAHKAVLLSATGTDE